ncbi:MAG: hypothetical protein U1E65_06405 [Myxococcota bacterium]
MGLLLALSLSLGGSTAWADGDRIRPFRLGLTNAFWVGFTGPLSNPVPAYNLGLDLGFPTGRTMRYHVEVGFENLNGHNGLKLAPLSIGYEAQLPEFNDKLHFSIEVMLMIVQAEVIFDRGYAIALSSGLRAQVVMVYEPFFVAFSPLGFTVRYAYGIQDTGIRTGAGGDWPFLLTIGAEL